MWTCATNVLKNSQSLSLQSVIKYKQKKGKQVYAGDAVELRETITDPLRDNRNVVTAISLYQWDHPPVMCSGPTWSSLRMPGQRPLYVGSHPLRSLGCDDVIPRVPASRYLVAPRG
jgi:hypothetical protein